MARCEKNAELELEYGIFGCNRILFSSERVELEFVFKNSLVGVL